MDSLSHADYAAPASHLAVEVDYGSMASGDNSTPFASRSVSPVFSCPSPTSSVSSFAQSTTTVEELADKLKQTGVVPASPPPSSRKSHAAERRRADRLHPNHLNVGPSRRYAVGRHHHDARRTTDMGSLVERMMSVDPQHARQCQPTGPTLQRRSDTAMAREPAPASPREDTVMGLAVDSGVPVDPIELVNAALHGRVRLNEVANSCRRRVPGPQRDVRVRKRPRIRPRP